MRSRLVPPLVLVLLTAGLYGRAVGFGFVWDDETLIAQNPLVTEARPLREIFSTHFFAGSDPGSVGWMYRPAVIALYRLEWMAGGKPWVFHLTNVLLHAAVAMLVFLLGRRVGASGRAAFAAAALFLVCPVQTEAAAWVSGLPDLLLGLGLALALLGVSSAEWPAAVRIGLSLVGSLLALLSKESALLAVPVLLGLVALSKEPVRRRLLLALALLFPLALSLVLRAHALGGLALLGEQAGDQSAAGRLARLGAQLSLLPGFQLGALPQVPRAGAARLVAQLVGLAVPVAMLVFAWVLHRRGRRGAGCVVVALALLLPTALVRLPALRYLYAPLLVLAAVGAPVLDRLMAWRQRRAAMALVGAMALIWAALGQLRLGDWQTEESLFSAEVVQEPANPDAQYFYGDLLLRLGHPRQASEPLQQALRLDPGHRAAWLSLTKAFLVGGQPRTAEEIVRTSLRGTPRTAPQYVLLGEVLLAQRRPLEALAAFEDALRTDPRSRAALAGGVRAAFAAPRTDRGRELARALLALDPRSGLAREALQQQ